MEPNFKTEPITKSDGGFSPSFNKKKKFQLNKKNIVIFGGLGIAAILLVMTLFKKPQQQQQAGGTLLTGDDGMPTNSADVQAQLQSFEDIIGSQVQSELGNFNAQLESNNASLLSEFTGILTTTTQSYEDKLNDYQSKFDALDQSNSELKTTYAEQLAKQKLEADAALKKAQSDAKKELDSFKKQDAEIDDKRYKALQKDIAKAEAAARKAREESQKAIANINKKPAPVKKPTPTKKPVPTKKPATNKKPVAKGLNVNTSIVDNLKSQGKDSSFAARKKLAAASGIKNYRGTAAQNTALLKKQKAAVAKKKVK